MSEFGRSSITWSKTADSKNTEGGNPATSFSHPDGTHISMHVHGLASHSFLFRKSISSEDSAVYTGRKIHNCPCRWETAVRPSLSAPTMFSHILMATIMRATVEANSVVSGCKTGPDSSLRSRLDHRYGSCTLSRSARTITTGPFPTNVDDAPCIVVLHILHFNLV